MTIDEKLNHFIQKMVEIDELDKQVGPQIKAIEANANAECNAISQKAMKDAAELRAPLLRKIEEYKAEVKAEFGVVDGEPVSIVQLLKVIHDATKPGAA